MQKPLSWMSLWVFPVLVCLVAAAGGAPPEPPRLPPMEVWGDGPVDEPIGPFYSCGLTLDHLGRDRAMIRKFHEHLAAAKIDPAGLGGKRMDAPPSAAIEIVLDPERLAAGELPAWGWKAEGNCIVGSAADDGPTVRLPLTIPRDGDYLIGIRHHGSTTLSGLTGFKIYSRGKESDGPLLIDEFNGRPAAVDGWVWHELIATLSAGDYWIDMPHITRQWHAPQGVGYGPRKIDCVYLTDALWRELPDEPALEAVRSGGKTAGLRAVRTVPLSAADRDAWKQWRIRPIGWDDARGNPRLFAASHDFWRRQLAALAADPLPPDADYREPRRQVVFDDVWNMVGNPRRIAEQAAALGGDVSAAVKPAHHYLKNAGAADERTGGANCDWWPQADKAVSGTYYNFAGELLYTQAVEPGHTYSFWVQFRDIGFFEPWQIWASWSGDPSKELHWKRDQRSYPADIQPQRAWVKIGDIKVPADATDRVIRWRIADLPWGGLQAVSYRWIYNFLITSDPDFKPKGTVMPPASTQDYLARLGRAGGRPEDGVVCQAVGDQPLPLDWFPADAKSVDRSIHMPPEAFETFQIGMRSAADEPVTVQVECEPLRGEGGTYEDRITWRVPAYVPYGGTRATWAAWCLLRRPYVTVPPYNAAAIHLQVDTRGMKPGEYTARIRLTPRGRDSGTAHPVRESLVTVKVSPVAIAPKKPVLVHGYTMPPEGEAYLQDYRAHGLKVWCGPLLSKDEMRRRGMLMQQVRARSSTNDYTGLVADIKQAGLAPEDYYVIVWDEPSGTTAAELGRFINAAEKLHALEPSLKRAFNPGEPAVLKTFELLDPHCEIWMPYDRHFIYHPNEAAAKTKIITSKPWMDYTTPCYADKEPQTGSQLFNQIRRVPAAQGPCLGTWFFALSYPFRDPWDAGYEHLKDASVFVLPSKHGPVATFAWESVRAGIQAADLATMVKERARPDDEQAQALIRGGSASDLLAWLERAEAAAGSR